jgi:hypothetical protein
MVTPHVRRPVSATIAPTSGEIEERGDRDYFKLSIPSSGKLTIQTTGSTDTYGYLLDQSGKTIASNDDSGSGANFRISKTLTTGSYYVQVRHASSRRTGKYTLFVEFKPSGSSISSYTLKVTKSSTGNGFVGSSPSGITCGTDCSHTYSSGTSVKLTATPVAGSRFLGWTGSCSGTGSCQLTMNNNRSVHANFADEEFPSSQAVDAFVRAKESRCTDMDGAYGCQCVDLMHSYIADVLGVPYSAHSIRGNAYPIFAKAGGSTTIQYGSRKVRLDKIVRSNGAIPRSGDIVFWNSPDGYGHVAVVLSATSTSLTTLDQNWVNSSLAHGSKAAKVTHRYDGSTYKVVGWFRPVLVSK